MANPVSIAFPNDENQGALGVLVKLVRDRPRGSAVRKVRRRLVEGAFSEGSSSIEPRVSPPVRLPGEGTSGMQPAQEIPQEGEPSPLDISYDKEIPIFKDPESLALTWRKLRTKDCVLPDLDKMSDREEYIRMAVANAKVSVLVFPSFLLVSYSQFVCLV